MEQRLLLTRVQLSFRAQVHQGSYPNHSNNLSKCNRKLANLLSPNRDRQPHNSIYQRKISISLESKDLLKGV